MACNGRTNGAAFAHKIKKIMDTFGLVGKMFGACFDGGSNLKTAHDELLRLQHGAYACTALHVPVMYCNRCLAHLINGACNGSVLKVKAQKFSVMPCIACLHFVMVSLFATLMAYICRS